MEVKTDLDDLLVFCIRFDPSSVANNGNSNEADGSGGGHNLDDFPPLNNKGVNATSSSPPIASAAGLLSF